MPYRIRRAHGGPLRDAKQGNRLLWVNRRHHGLEILDPAIEGNVADVPIRHPGPPLVVAHEAEMVSEEANPMSPDGTLALDLEVGQPVGGLDQDGAGPGPGLGPGEPDAVRGPQIADDLTDPLLHQRLISLTCSGTFVLRNCRCFYSNRVGTPMAERRADDV